MMVDPDMMLAPLPQADDADSDQPSHGPPLLPWIEAADRPDDPVDLLLSKGRVHRDAQHLLGRAFGLGTPDVAEPQPAVQGARVDRRRVVDPGPDAQGGKMPGQPVPNRRNPERILMVDVGRAPRFPRDGEPVQALQPGRQPGRVLPPPRAPLLQPR